MHDFSWKALSFVDDQGPYVSIEGMLWGREVYLRLLASPPEDEEPGLKVDTTRRRAPGETREPDAEG